MQPKHFSVSFLHYQRGALLQSPITVLVLVALLVGVFSLYVVEKAAKYENSTEVADETGTHQEYHWRLVTSWPKNFPGLGVGPENFAKLVNGMSAGRLQVHVYGAGELVPALGVLDAVSTGSVEMGHTASYYHKGKIPAAVLFTAIPFGMNTMEQNAWLHHGGGLEMWRELYEPINVIPFAGGNTGMQMGGWFNKKIESLDDVKGLKMRIPGMAGEVFTRAGGTAVTLPGGEIYTSMQTGVIDATEWVGPYNDRAFGLNEVGTNYYFPGWQEPTAMLEFDVNLDAWNSLPADLQKIIEVAARAINQDMLDEYVARNGQSLVALKEENGIVPQRFPTEVLAELKEIAVAYYAEVSETDEDFKRIYDSYSTFYERTYNYLKISEKAVFKARQDIEEYQAARQ